MSALIFRAVSRALAASLAFFALCCGEGPRPAAPALALEPVGTVPLRLMPLGDSITRGDAEHDSYRRPLWQLLAAGGYSVDFVGSQSANLLGGSPHDDFDNDHEGHGGWRADEILERIAEWAGGARPDIVIVHLGSNDVFQDQSLQSTIDDLGHIIDRLRAINPRVKILLAQVIGVANAHQNEGIRRLNSEIAALAGRKTADGSAVVLVDQFTGFQAAEDTHDGVHPDLSGEVKLAQRWFTALEALSLPRRVTP